MSKTIFNTLKKTLIESGYEVLLMKASNWPKADVRHRRRGIKGYIVPDEMKIYINQSIGINDRVVTLIHELLHEIAPDWTEHQVETTAIKAFKGLSVSQLGFLQFFVVTPAETKSLLRQHRLASSLC
jgi:hypothetical protein